MIKKLQMKFVCIIMSLLTVVLVFIFGAINIVMYKVGKENSINTMRKIARNEGLKPFSEKASKQKLSKQNIGTSPQYANIFEHIMPPNNFSVKLTDQNKILEVVLDKRFSCQEEKIEEIVELILNERTRIGMVENQRFLIQERPYGKIIVCLDSNAEMNMIYRLLWISILVGGVSLIILFFIVLGLSAWTIKPVKIAFERQKQFVADASHELKTPLTVIGANADVLESEIGSNKWLGFIKTEIKRMSELVNNLLYLTKVDSEEVIYRFQEFNLSESIMSVILPFESVVYEEEKSLSIDIEEEVFFKGDENRIKQIVMILLDNALKHAYEKGEIEVTLRMQGRKIILTVFNTGEAISEEQRDKIFERFYRTDESRARETGGFGLGLAIAKAIVERHEGAIYCKSEKGKGIYFFVEL